jgi:hypothetical protein
MNPRRIITAATAAALLGAGALAPVGSAADDGAATDTLAVTGAHAYVDPRSRAARSPR